MPPLWRVVDRGWQSFKRARPKRRLVVEVGQWQVLETKRLENWWTRDQGTLASKQRPVETESPATGLERVPPKKEGWRPMPPLWRAVDRRRQSFERARLKRRLVVKVGQWQVLGTKKLGNWWTRIRPGHRPMRSSQQRHHLQLQGRREFHQRRSGGDLRFPFGEQWIEGCNFFKGLAPREARWWK